MTKFINIIILLTFGSAFSLLLLIVFWLNYPYQIIKFNDSLYPVITKTVKAGGVLKYSSNYCKYSNLAPMTTRSFVDGLVYSTKAETTNREIGCHTITVGVKVPLELPGGVYHLENTFVYQVNPVRIETVSHSSEDFTVIEAP